MLEEKIICLFSAKQGEVCAYSFATPNGIRSCELGVFNHADILDGRAEIREAVSQSSKLQNVYITCAAPSAFTNSKLAAYHLLARAFLNELSVAYNADVKFLDRKKLIEFAQDKQIPYKDTIDGARVFIKIPKNSRASAVFNRIRSKISSFGAAISLGVAEPRAEARYYSRIGRTANGYRVYKRLFI